MNKLKKAFIFCALSISGMGIANAHTTSIGFVPGTNPGEVTFWTGSYDHGSTPTNNEGTLTLTGINSTSFGPDTRSFNITPTSTKPSGLVDGTSNFYWTQAGSTFTLDQSLTADPGLFGGVAWWQGVTFSGLNPGDYSFSCGTTCGTTAQWHSLASGSGNLTLTGANIGGGGATGGTVPEPSILALLALGLMGMRFGGSKKAVMAA